MNIFFNIKQDILTLTNDSSFQVYMKLRENEKWQLNGGKKRFEKKREKKVFIIQLMCTNQNQGNIIVQHLKAFFQSKCSNV